MRTNQTPPSHRLIGKFQCQVNCQTTFLSDIKRVWYCSPTRIPNRDKKTESPYLVHPLTYRQVYLTKDAYFVEKIHCELLVCLKITHLTWIWNSYLFNFCMNFPPCIQAFFLFYASWQEIRILVLFGWGKNARCSVVLLSIRFFRPATVLAFLEIPCKLVTGTS